MTMKNKLIPLIGLILILGWANACQTLPEEKRPQPPKTAEEFKTVLALTESQFLRVEPILSRFLSDQKELQEKSKSESGPAEGASAGVREKMDRLTQLAAQDLKPYLTPEQLAHFTELTRPQGGKTGGRGGGRHSGSGGMGHGGQGNLGF